VTVRENLFSIDCPKSSGKLHLSSGLRDATKQRWSTSSERSIHDLEYEVQSGVQPIREKLNMSLFLRVWILAHSKRTAKTQVIASQNYS